MCAGGHIFILEWACRFNLLQFPLLLQRQKCSHSLWLSLSQSPYSGASALSCNTSRKSHQRGRDKKSTTIWAWLYHLADHTWLSTQSLVELHTFTVKDDKYLSDLTSLHLSGKPSDNLIWFGLVIYERLIYVLESCRERRNTHSGDKRPTDPYN